MILQQFYKGFDLISLSDISDYESKGIYVRHRKTGLEVFHLFNSDKENLFAFAFRTPAADSTGAAHILEHSVFCGSEKFPLKEPFVNLMNQSVYTFLNAMTYSDKTVYPASSINKKDYFHLLDVYSDAVFFPLLKRETFLQEGHRLEIDENGNYAIQGVVYNEMKGNYSSFNSVAFDEQFKSLFSGTCYVNDSGGDPLVIPSLTYEDFKKFHRTYYSPANCLLFLYGNIATEEQLDFIQETVLTRLEKIYPMPKEQVVYPAVKKEFMQLETPCPIDKEVTVHAVGPASDAKESTVTLNWRYGKSSHIDDTMEVIFLLQLLSGNDGAPISKALTDAHLGERLIAGGGGEGFLQMLYFGLSGVKKQHAAKVRETIISTLTTLCEKGIPQSDIDAAVLAVDFANREVVRAHGEPFAIELMDRALNGWNYGTEPSATLAYRTAFEKIKTKLANDAQYAEHLIKKILLENTARSFVIVTPDKSFLQKRTEAEKQLITAFSKKTSREVVKRETDALHAYQRYRETEKELACIPHINPSDLKPYVEPIETEITSCKGVDGSDVPLFINTEPTNGIVYIDVCFPADVLPLSDYTHIYPFTICAANTGWQEKKWDECSREVSLCCGDMSVRAFTGTVCIHERNANLFSDDKNYIGRDWIVFSIKLPVEKTAQALSLFSEAIIGMEFNDIERIKTLIEEAYNEMRSSLIPAGSRYALLRAARKLNRTNAIEELWSGLTLFFTLKKIINGDYAALGRQFTRIISDIRGAGGIVHVTADKKSLETVLPLIPDFVKRVGLHALIPAPVHAPAAYYALTNFESEKDDEMHEVCLIASQVGYVAKVVNCGKQSAMEQGALKVLCHWMKTNILWERIRTTGGAYGAAAFFNYIEEMLAFSTYRDPNPVQSLETFMQCFNDVCSIDFNDDDIARAVTGTYGEIVHPQAPGARGYLGFKQKLYAITEDVRNELVKAVLAVDASGLHIAAEKIKKVCADMNTVIICDKSIKTTGFIIDLSL